MQKLLAIIIIRLLFTDLLFAQHTFIKHYGTSNGEFGTALTLTDSSAMILCQTVYDPNYILFGLNKVDANGHLQWSRVYKAKDNSQISNIVKWRSGYIILGTTWDTGSNQYFLFLSRINKTGDILWMKKYSVSQADMAAALSINNDRFYVTATADYNIGAVYTKLFWMQTDSSGNVEHSKMYSTPFQHNNKTSFVGYNGKTGIASESNGYGTGSPTFKNMIVTQLDTAGNVEWSNSFSTHYDDEVSDMVGDSGEWIITGRSAFALTGWDLSIYRIDATGNLLFSGYYDAGTADGEVGRTIIRKPGEGCVIAGDAGTFNERNMMLLSADLNGNIIWSNEYPVSVLFTNYPYDLIELKNDSGYAFTGDLRPPSTFRNAALFRTDSAGNAGCLTTPINFNKRPDTVEVLNAPLTDVTFNLVVDTVVPQEFNIGISENSICEFPVASFSFTTDTLCPLLCFNFKDESINATSWQWTFPHGDPPASNLQQPPQVCYDSAGIYSVSLTVTLAGYSNTATKIINMESFCDTTSDTIFIPSAISPDGDFKNDQFVIKNLPDNFYLSIYNRWGNLIFESRDKNKVWPEKINSGQPHDGVYYYILEAYLPGETRKYHGTISIFNK